MLTKSNLLISLVIILLVSLTLYFSKDIDYLYVSSNRTKITTPNKNLVYKNIKITKAITIGQYFKFLDSIVKKYDSVTSYKLNEHLLVRANPWIIDTLKNTDYYIMKSRDSFVLNQKEMTALPKNTHINIPDTALAKKILQSFEKTIIDINIPEYKLRIYENSVKLFEFPIRVGRNEKKYLKMADRIVDLKTKIGKGYIVNHVRNPDYFNPVNGHQYFVTKRDDKKVTKLPQIPFIETEINGILNGQLIHPTTNPVTLNKAYSNGCIGTKEGDAWIIYYYAPIGTKIRIRYDLNVEDKSGKKLILKDIYNHGAKP